MQHHKYSLTELESMLPWERDIYVSLLIQYIEEENEKDLKSGSLSKLSTSVEASLSLINWNCLKNARSLASEIDTCTPKNK